MNAKEYRKKHDIPKTADWSRQNAALAEMVEKSYRTGGALAAMKVFDAYCKALTDFGYWYILRALWRQCGHVEGPDTFWPRHFLSDRPDRARSIMRPSELRKLYALPQVIKAWRPVPLSSCPQYAYYASRDAAKAAILRKPMNYHATALVPAAVPKKSVLAYFDSSRQKELIVMNQTEVVEHAPEALY